MSDIDIVIEIAEKAFAGGNGNGNYRLWDRAQRIARNVEHIIDLENLLETDIPIDRFSLAVAAYFSYAHLAHKACKTAGKFPQTEAETAFELSAKIAAEKLNTVLSDLQTIKVGKIITESGNRFTKMTEAIILSDARNLDDMGAVEIFSELGRFLSEGKGLSELLNSWRRKVAYHYWDARLKESFRFPSIQLLAQRRFDAVANFMNQLEIEISASDIKDLTLTRVNA